MQHERVVPADELVRVSYDSAVKAWQCVSWSLATWTLRRSRPR